MKSILYELRVQHGLTQSQLSKKLGVSQPEVARLERGKRRIRFDLLQKMAVIFKMSVDEITKMQVDITPPEPDKVPDGVPLIGETTPNYKLDVTDLKPHKYLNLNIKFDNHFCLKIMGCCGIPRFKPDETLLCENHSTYNKGDDIFIQYKEDVKVYGFFGEYIGSDEKQVTIKHYCDDVRCKANQKEKFSIDKIVKISKIVGCFSI